MQRKLALFGAVLFLSVNLYGCLLVAGAAGGAGTAVWLSGKLVEEENAPLDRSYDASKRALGSFNYPIDKDTRKADVAQLVAKHTDGRMIWVDVHRISDVRSRISVRVGAKGDQEAARALLDRIKSNL
jgi:hypothetical protein